MTPGTRIRRADPSDIESLVAFTMQEAIETEGEAPVPDAVRLAVRAGLEGTVPSTWDLRLYVLQSNERAIAAYRRRCFEVAPYALMTRSL